MLDLYQRGRSRSERGGTLLTYATHLSHLVRFCYTSDTPFLHLTDAQFSFFVIGLLGERQDNGSLIRKQNSVLNVVRTCLKFIHYLSCTLAWPAKLTLQIRPYSLVLPDRSKIQREGMSHAAMPLPTRVSRRLPINSATIKRLRLAAFGDPHASAFVKERRRVMIRTLEMTGGRRLELKHLTLAAVAHARQTGHLRMLVAKQAGQTLASESVDESRPRSYREIPLAERDIQLLSDYVDFHRAPIIARCLPGQVDHGYLFISETTGLPLRANTFTFEIQRLRTLGDIKEPVSPHLFRHRFITKIFVAQILHHPITTFSDFKEALLSTETLKRKVQELTGHRNIHSLDVYIHLAWDEAGQLQHPLPVLDKLQCLSAISEQVTQLIARQTKSPLTQDSQALLELLGAFEALL